jgi:signal transduction histidine kinase
MLEPMSALVNTVKTQVILTSVVLIIFAIVLVVVMSRIITAPIIRINESAKGLGRGKYDIEFKGDSYREISELSDTLNYVTVELSKNDKLQKELISNVSHDLRTPLTMIRGYSELMRDIPGEVTPENFQVIIDETTRLAELVNAMLDLSKIQSGVRVPDKQLFCLTEIIKSTLIRYEKLVTQESYRLDFTFDDEVFVCADRNMILQVVYNFMNNAINYTGEDKYVRVEQKVVDNKIRISITDTGEGISEDEIPLIWERYYKVDKVHKRATVGTGLGLSIVKEILEIHNATYGVSSTLGKGSTFWFELKTSDSQEYKAEVVDI